MENKKSLKARLQAARVDLQGRYLQKSGENKFSKYSYYELADILPTINELGVKYGFLTVFNIDTTIAKLTIVDTENESETTIEFSTFVVNPPAPKGTNELQNLGSIHTYLRRYLLLNAFEIVEQDLVEAQKKEQDRLHSEKINAIKSEFEAAKTASEFTQIKKTNLDLIKGSEDLQNFAKACFDKLSNTLPFAIDLLLTAESPEKLETVWNKYPQYHHEDSFIEAKKNVKF